MVHFLNKITDGQKQLQSNQNDMHTLKTNITTAQSSLSNYSSQIQGLLKTERDQSNSVDVINRQVHEFIDSVNQIPNDIKDALGGDSVRGRIARAFGVQQAGQDIGILVRNYVDNHARPVLDTLIDAHQMFLSLDKLLTDSLSNISQINSQLTQAQTLFDQIDAEQNKAVQAMQDIQKYFTDMQKAA